MTSKPIRFSRLFSALLVIAGLLFLESCCRRHKSVTTNTEKELQHSQIVNFYVENSGSMKGFFTGDSKIKDIIKEYNDRIDDSKAEGDTITLNYISTDIENYSSEIKDYIQNCQSVCTASYTKIDDILSMAMEGVNDSTVNIVISDYCFDSNDSSFPMAQSDITKIFTKKLKANENLSVAIIKYMSDFDGKYFSVANPRGTHINKPLPFYLWIVGNEKQVKRIVDLPIKSHNCGILVLQTNQIIRPNLDNIKTKKARMVEDGAIVVKEWDKDRNRNATKYSVSFELDLSKIILHEEDICNINNYQISEGYMIESIEKKENDQYTFNISTEKPSPGTVSIKFLQYELPEWVEKSNYSDTGIPSDSTTYGVKYLIGGVYDAYHNQSNILFETEITLK